MLWDVLFAVGIGLSQLLLTWYGVHVSVRENRLRNAVIIGLVGLVGVGLTVGGTIRNSINQEKLQAQLNQIQNNTKQPTIVNVQPPAITLPTPKEHSHVDFLSPFPPDPSFPLLPFHKDEKPVLNIGYRNGGDFQVRDASGDAKIILVPKPLGHVPVHVFDNNRNLLRAINVGGVLNPHTGDILYHSYVGEPLSEEDVSELNVGRKALCVISMVIWRDDTGQYETDFSQCFMNEIIGRQNFNWHVLADNNVEHKLH